MKNISVAPSPQLTLNYVTLKSVTSPEDQDSGRRRYCGIVKADALRDLPWDENVRSYLGTDEQGKNRKPTLVNLAIRNTVEERRDLFPLLNTGVVIVAKEATVEDGSKRARLRDASIINGAQTKGELDKYFAEHQDDKQYPSVSIELIITDDDELIGDISVARNFQNRVYLM